MKDNGDIGPICLEYTEIDKDGDIPQQMEEKRAKFLENDEETRKQIRDCAEEAMGKIMESIEDKPEKCMEEMKKNCIFREEE